MPRQFAIPNNFWSSVRDCGRSIFVIVSILKGSTVLRVNRLFTKLTITFIKLQITLSNSEYDLSEVNIMLYKGSFPCYCHLKNYRCRECRKLLTSLLRNFSGRMYTIRYSFGFSKCTLLPAFENSSSTVRRWRWLHLCLTWWPRVKTNASVRFFWYG